MTSPLLLSALALSLAAAPGRGRSAGSRLEVGQREFNRGDPLAALKALDAALAETTDGPTLARIQLLRGQCFAASGNFGDAEAAFQAALSHDPEAALDPAKVDPSLVRLLDGLRARLSGTVRVRTEPPGAVVRLDEAPFPQGKDQSVSAGRHRVTARTSDGRFEGEAEVVVRPNARAEVSLPLREVVAPAGVTPRRPFADLRLAADPFQLEGGVEVGGGFEWPFYRLSLHARVAPEFGLTPRGAVSVPLNEKLTGYVEVELPLLFLNEVAFGLGGAGGVEFFPLTRWFGPFVQLGARHFFFAPEGYTGNRFTVQLGARLRLP